MFVFAQWSEVKGTRLSQRRLRFTLLTSLYHISHFKAYHIKKGNKCPSHGFLVLNKEGKPKLCIHESPQIRMVIARGYRSKGNNIFSSESFVDVALLKDAVTEYLKEKHEPLTSSIKISIMESL